jgi:hypothetical protein
MEDERQHERDDQDPMRGSDAGKPAPQNDPTHSSDERSGSRRDSEPTRSGAENR